MATSEGRMTQPKNARRKHKGREPRPTKKPRPISDVILTRMADDSTSGLIPLIGMGALTLIVVALVRMIG